MTIYNEPDTVAFGETTSSNKFNKLVAAIKAIWKGSAAGDLEYYSSNDEKTRIPIGNEGQVLKVISGIPSWGEQLAQLCIIGKTSNQTINFYQTVVLTWDTEILDDWNGHDNSVNNSRITIINDGIYLPIIAIAATYGASAGYWSAYLKLNGTVIQTQRVAYGPLEIHFVASPLLLTAGDYLEVSVFEGFLLNNVEQNATITVTGTIFSLLKIR